jgi:hypothetical protein
MHVFDLKVYVKRSPTLNSMYKLLRDARDVQPRRKWLRVDEMSTVFTVLSRVV